MEDVVYSREYGNMTNEDFYYQREFYNQKWWELFIGLGMQKYLEENVEAGTPLPVVLSYGPGINIPEFHDEGFYERNGITPINFHKKMFELLNEEIKSEYQLRKQKLIDYVVKSGLTEHGSEIFEGMNRSVMRAFVPLEDAQNSHPLYLRERFILRNSDELLNFALDYVDRWKMYKELFSSKT